MQKKADYRPRNTKTNWREYQAHPKELERHDVYELSSEAEDELLRHGVFLKHRVWQNMHKIRRQHAADAGRLKTPYRDLKIRHHLRLEA